MSSAFVVTAALLILSNPFMTLACCRHLRFTSLPLQETITPLVFIVFTEVYLGEGLKP
jgi:uncharacterized protein (DUF486 family)